MGLFGSKEKPEDIMYNAMDMLEKNQPKAAISLFNKVLKQEPKNIEALLNKGLALNQIRKYSDAVTCFEKLIEINPPIALAIMIQLPNLVLLFTNAAPTIPKIEKNIAENPKYTISEPPPNALLSPPTIIANIDAKNPKIPPNNPNTNSLVLFPIL